MIVDPSVFLQELPRSRKASTFYSYVIWSLRIAFWETPPGDASQDANWIFSLVAGKKQQK